MSISEMLSSRVPLLLRDIFGLNGETSMVPIDEAMCADMDALPVDPRDEQRVQHALDMFASGMGRADAETLFGVELLDDELAAMVPYARQAAE